MQKYVLDTWAEASSEAKRLAETYSCTIRIGREGTRFFIEIPDAVDYHEDYSGAERVREDELMEEELEKFNSEWQPAREQDGYDEEWSEIKHELNDTNDSYARSEESGWYYDDTDPD